MTATGNEAVKLSQLQTALAVAGGGGFSEIAADIPANGTVTAEGWTIKNVKDFTIGVFAVATSKTLFLTAIQSKQYYSDELSGLVLEITKDGAGVYNDGDAAKAAVPQNVCGAFTDNFSVTKILKPDRYEIYGSQSSMTNALFMAGVLMLSNDFA